MRLSAVALLAAGLVVVSYGISLAQPAPPPVSCQKVAWQYKLLSPFDGVPFVVQMKAVGNWQDYRSIVERALTEAGADGWEAVGVMPGNDQVRTAVLLKRPVCL